MYISDSTIYWNMMCWILPTSLSVYEGIWCCCRRFLVTSKQYSIIFAFIFQLHMTFFMLFLLPKLLHLQKYQTLVNYNNIFSEAYPFDWLVMKSSLLLPCWWFQTAIAYSLPGVLPYILFFQLLYQHLHSCNQAEFKV